MPACRNCGTHVTDQFARVFGDNEDAVHSCMGCSSHAELGLKPDGDPPERQTVWSDGG